jgi:hypothetical protein
MHQHFCAACRRPSDSRFPSLEVFERRPHLGPTASLCKGPASENLHNLRRRATSAVRPLLILHRTTLHVADTAALRQRTKSLPR